MKFEEIIGNKEEKEVLENAVFSGKISHSYMFLGIDGIGKKLIAREFAKKILCLSNEKNCEECKSCIEFEAQSHPDFKEVVPDGRNIKIDQIREFQQKVYEKPVISQKKVYIIDDAESMTKEAQNCLLKTLEEPPEYTVIILIVSDEDKLLNTIKSRCTKMLFNKLTIEELKEFNNNESIEDKILLRANGSIKKLIHIKENRDIYIKLEDIINKIDKQPLLDVLKEAELFTKNKEIINEILDYMNVMFFEETYGTNLCIKQAEFINCMQIIEEVKRRISSNSNFDMSIDYLLIKIWEEINEECSRG